MKYKTRRTFKRYRKGRRVSFRGMQKVKTVRWPMRNPMGDRMFYKPLTVYGGVLTVPTSASYISQNLAFNDMAAINTLWGDCPGMGLIGTAYAQYRIRGIALRITVWPDPAQAAVPVCVYTNAAQDSTDLINTPSVSRVTEQRWCRYKVCNAAGTGARPTSLSVYYSVNKVWGPDNVVKNDLAFTGETGGSSTVSTWTPPANTPILQYGLFTMSGLNPTTAIACTVKIESKLYFEGFSRSYTATA